MSWAHAVNLCPMGPWKSTSPAAMVRWGHGPGCQYRMQKVEWGCGPPDLIVRGRSPTGQLGEIRPRSVRGTLVLVGKWSWQTPTGAAFRESSWGFGPGFGAQPFYLERKCRELALATRVFHIFLRKVGTACQNKDSEWAARNCGSPSSCDGDHMYDVLDQLQCRE